jgi:hypothetical protein
LGRLSQLGTRLAIHGGLAWALIFSCVLGLATFSPGCGSSGGDAIDGGDDGSGSTCTQFIASESAFNNFTSWKVQYHLTTKVVLAPDGGVDTVHGQGPRDVYVNLGSPGQPPCPAEGATEFPQGTILVKVMPQTNLMATDVFAQVKRGCGVNAGGAEGWEWFDLLTDQNGGPKDASILWQGYSPPASSQYGGNPTECNVCHAAMGAGNDSVITSELDIKNFPCK